METAAESGLGTTSLGHFMVANRPLVDTGSPCRSLVANPRRNPKRSRIRPDQNLQRLVAASDRRQSEAAVGRDRGGPRAHDAHWPDVSGRDHHAAAPPLATPAVLAIPISRLLLRGMRTGTLALALTKHKAALDHCRCGGACLVPWFLLSPRTFLASALAITGRSPRNTETTTVPGEDRRSVTAARST